jgi:excisionase family DNA binding protein
VAAYAFAKRDWLVDQLLTVREAARRLSCSEAAIRKWIYQQRLPAVKVGRLVRIAEGDLEIFVGKAELDNRSNDQ